MRDEPVWLRVECRVFITRATSSVSFITRATGLLDASHRGTPLGTWHVRVCGRFSLQSHVRNKSSGLMMSRRLGDKISVRKLPVTILLKGAFGTDDKVPKAK